MSITFDGLNPVAVQAAQTVTVIKSTTNTNDIICCVVHNVNSVAAMTSTVTGGGLTWTLRKRETDVVGGLRYALEFWYAVAANALTTQTFTATATRSDGVLRLQAFALSGCNTSTIFDGTAVSGHATSTNPTGSISTSASNTIVLGLVGSGLSTGNLTAGSGYTMINQSGDGTDGIGAEYQLFSSPQTNKTVDEVGASSNWQIIIDAILSADQPDTGTITMNLQPSMTMVAAGAETMTGTLPAYNLSPSLSSVAAGEAGADPGSSGDPPTLDVDTDDLNAYYWMW